MKLQKLFPLLTVVFFLSTCILIFTVTGSFGQCDVDFSNPAAVGDFILNAIKESNVAAFECTFNQASRSKSINVKEYMQECITHWTHIQKRPAALENMQT